MKLRPGTNVDPKVWSAKGYEFIQKKDYENVCSLLPLVLHLQDNSL